MLMIGIAIGWCIHPPTARHPDGTERVSMIEISNAAAETVLRVDRLATDEHGIRGKWTVKFRGRVVDSGIVTKPDVVAITRHAIDSAVKMAPLHARPAILGLAAEVTAPHAKRGVVCAVQGPLGRCESEEHGWAVAHYVTMAGIRLAWFEIENG
jgi:hypothetical protein